MWIDWSHVIALCTARPQKHRFLRPLAHVAAPSTCKVTGLRLKLSIVCQNLRCFRVEPRSPNSIYVLEGLMVCLLHNPVQGQTGITPYQLY